MLGNLKGQVTNKELDPACSATYRCILQLAIEHETRNSEEGLLSAPVLKLVGHGDRTSLGSLLAELPSDTGHRYGDAVVSMMIPAMHLQPRQWPTSTLKVTSKLSVSMISYVRTVS